VRTAGRSGRGRLAALAIAAALVAACGEPLPAGFWRPTGRMTLARSGHTLTVLRSGMVLAAGGFNAPEPVRRSQFRPTASAELYDPATGIWSPTGWMSTPRWSHSAVMLDDGRVLVVGGYAVPNPEDPYAQPDQALTSAELYDPATGAWSPTGSMSARRAASQAVLLADGKVLIMGGVNLAGTAVVRSSECYDPATGTWLPTGALNTPRARSTRAVRLLDDRVLVVGGAIDKAGFGATAVTEIYDPALGRWQVTGPLDFSIVFHSLVLLPSGEVLLLGGCQGGDGQPNCGTGNETSARLFDPSAGTWREAAPMPVGRTSLKAVVLGSGKVLVAAGHTGAAATQVDVYDPDGDGWSQTLPLRHDHLWGSALALLHDGEVLIAGGHVLESSNEAWDFEVFTLDVAELY
jgi:large repetitive protein